MTRYTPQWLQQGNYAASVDRRLIGSIWPASAVSGCAVTVASGMTVNIAAGQVAVPSQNNTGSTLCTSDATEQVSLTAAPAAGTNRYDVIVCQPRGNDLDGGANNDFVFAVITGTAAASPTVPAVPAGQTALAQIYVPGGSASVTAGNIADRRNPLTDLWRAPRGQLTRSQYTGHVTGVGSGGWNITATPSIYTPAGRRIKLTGHVNVLAQAGATVVMVPWQDGAVLPNRLAQCGPVSTVLEGTAYITTTAGIHSWSWQITSTTTVELYNDYDMAYCEVEDIGAYP